ncbi:MAG: hypothetical protein U1D55_02905 [Phycisphaerae bacterium]
MFVDASASKVIVLPAAFASRSLRRRHSVIIVIMMDGPACWVAARQGHRVGIRRIRARLPDRDIVERRRCVGLRPQTDHAGALDRVVAHVEQLLPIKEAQDVVAEHFRADRVPFSRLGADIDRLKLLTLTGNHVVDAEVAFQGIDAANVVVVSVLAAPNQPAALIFLAAVRTNAARTSTSSRAVSFTRQRLYVRTPLSALSLSAFGPVIGLGSAVTSHCAFPS